MQLIDVLYMYGPAWTREDTVYMLLDPLVDTDFEHLCSFPDRMPLKKALFKDALRGIQALHDAGWMHIDIKPANIGIVWSTPPKAVILDLGHARPFAARGGFIESSPGYRGTNGYHAPEVEAVDGRFSASADIWSLGCTGLRLFDPESFLWERNYNPWRMDDLTPENAGERQTARHNYGDALRRLFNADRRHINSLLIKMLALDPDTRITAVHALGHASLY